MKNNLGASEPYKTIGEITKELGLVNDKTGQLQTHTIRYWEKQFKQIRPLIKAGKRRYYSEKNFEIIKLVKFLLKEKGMTISGVKKMLNEKDTLLLDEKAKLGLYKTELRNPKLIKDKVRKISKIIKELKKYK